MQLRHYGHGLCYLVLARGKHLHTAFAHRVQCLPGTTRRLLGAGPFDGDRMRRLHTAACRLDHRVSGGDDVGGRAIVFDQVGGLGVVVRLEAADEFDGCTRERVDVLIVVAHGEE